MRLEAQEAKCKPNESNEVNGFDYVLSDNNAKSKII
jgi:hypothetical protein